MAPNERLLQAIVRVAQAWRDPDHAPRSQAAEKTLQAPNRFTPEALAFAVNQQMSLLRTEAIEQWLAGRHATRRRAVGVLNAGNLPMVGLQDFLAVVLTGHAYVGALSKKSPILLPAFVEAVRRAFAPLLASFAPPDQMWQQAQAVIATGSNQTRAWAAEKARVHGIPQSQRLLRGHRYGVAVIDGTETEADRDRLSEDALLHEGAGCRSIALIWAPKGLSPDPYLESFAAFRTVFPAHETTPGLLAMQKAFLQALDAPHAYGDGLEFLLSRGEASPQGPGHLRWVEYEDLTEVAAALQERAAELQCVVAPPGVAERLPDTLPTEELGNAQRPPLAWNPDGVDTVAFLARL